MYIFFLMPRAAWFSIIKEHNFKNGQNVKLKTTYTSTTNF